MSAESTESVAAAPAVLDEDHLIRSVARLAWPVVIQQVSQTTEGMGVWVDADGQKCIADAIWDADTILPGQTPLKWILGYGEESNESVCE